jgi:phosphatidylserine/phosphatidylglycerophosphate/cardiolipin synthase-like enzyme
MTKKSSNKSSEKAAKSSSEGKKSTSQPRSILATVLGGIILVIAFIISQITGIDLTATPTTAPPTAGPTQVIPTSAPGGVTTIAIQQGFGAQKGFWQVFFTAPTGSSRSADYVNGIDGPLAASINSAQRTLDIAAFEFNNPVLTKAVVDARGRGVTVRMVTDDEHGLEDDDSTIDELIDAGVQVVDDGRSALMHNKFMIIDSTIVWTGSTNYTVNDIYRNNNNMISLRSRRAVEAYQAEFDEMFVDKQFGPRSPNTNSGNFNQDGTPIQIYFAPEGGRVLPAIIDTVSRAQRSVRFMAFSFTDDALAVAIQQRANAGVNVQGIFERVGSETSFSELTRLFCAGLQVRQDGNKYILHHKVFIIDDTTVVSGSFNFSANAMTSNDENLIIIQDSDLAAQFVAEFNRRWAEAITPTGLTCS